jgi:hypothetical protein
MAYRSRPVESNDDEGNSEATASAPAASESPNDTPNTNTNTNGLQNGTAVAPPRRRGPLQRLRRRGTASERTEPAGPARQRLMEEHFRVDTDKRLLLPGVPRHDPDWARDSHDFFNLVVLVPLVVLNVMNWNWDMLFNMPKNKFVTDAWTGEWWDMFFLVTVLYFTTDLAWVVFLPSCVRSPSTIILPFHILSLRFALLWDAVYQWRSIPGFSLPVGSLTSRDFHHGSLISASFRSG